MGVAKKNGDRFYDFVDSEVQCLFYKNRSAENTQIPSPWLFLWVATDPRMIQASKELHIILSRSWSGRLPGSRLAQASNAVESNNGNALRNADVVTSSICATSHCSVASKSRHDAWRMERDSFARSFDQTMT
jgi:hypothetical protein